MGARISAKRGSRRSGNICCRKIRDSRQSSAAVFEAQMDYVTVRVQSLPGDERLTLVLDKDATCWDIKNALKTLIGVPRRQQHLVLGERVLATSDKLGCNSEEIILTLIVVKPSCSYCGSQQKLRRCAGCNGAYYCGPICQLFDWQRGHELACGGPEGPRSL